MQSRQRSERMDLRNRQKIFCVGLNKTGTTSFGDALERTGLRRLGWEGGLSSRLLLRWYEHQKRPFVDHALQYDVLEDLPWPLVYRWMDEAFPNARFVLTVRASTAEWLASIQAHIRRSDSPWFGHRMIYGSYDAVADAGLYTSYYEAHNAAVRAHFAGRPAKLLELAVGGGDEGAKLSAFLGIPGIVFPHSNPRPDAPAIPVPAGVVAPSITVPPAPVIGAVADALAGAALPAAPTPS
jgi:hypothetical protein